MYSISEVADSIFGRITFMGAYNSDTNYDIGNVVLRDGESWICVDTYPHKWEPLGSNDIPYTVPKTTEIEISYQCRNCGAPTDEGGYCRYCGTINRKERKFNI